MPTVYRLSPCQVAGQDTKHRSSTDLRHIWHWSLPAICPTALDRTRHSYEWELAAETGSQLKHGTRSHGGQQKRYKDILKSNYLKACSIAPYQLETLPQDRSSWRTGMWLYFTF